MTVPPLYGQSSVGDNSSDNGISEEDQHAFEALQATRQYKKDLRDVRSKIRKAILVNSAFKRYARQEIQNWKQAMTEHIQAIKQTKKALFQQIRQSEAAKNRSAAARTASGSKAAFLKKYNLKYWQRRKLKLRRHRSFTMSMWTLQHMARLRL